MTGDWGPSSQCWWLPAGLKHSCQTLSHISCLVWRDVTQSGLRSRWAEVTFDETLAGTHASTEGFQPAKSSGRGQPCVHGTHFWSFPQPRCTKVRRGLLGKTEQNQQAITSYNCQEKGPRVWEGSETRILWQQVAARGEFYHEGEPQSRHYILFIFPGGAVRWNPWSQALCLCHWSRWDRSILTT